LRLSEGTHLAFLEMAIVPAAEGGASVFVLATRLDASAAHLSKVMQRLVKSGLLKAKRGPNGGYTLARAAEDIALLEVYETLEGRFRQDGCLFEAPVCHRADCILGGLVEHVRQEIHKHFSNTTLADLEGL